VISLCAAGFPGTDRALRELSLTCGLTRHLTIPAGADEPAIEFLIDVVREQQPRWVIFGSWNPVYERFMRSLSCRFAVYWTSSPGQVEISEEAETLARLLQDKRVGARLFLSEPLAAGLAGQHLPATLAQTTPMPRVSESPPGLSLFCSPSEYRRKNVLNVLLGLAEVRQPYRLHVNGMGSHPLYCGLLEGIAHVDHGWMTSEQYRSVMAGIDLGLQVSFSESFSYVVAEHIAQGVPVVASPMVPVVGRMSAGIRQDLVVDEPDSPQAIGQAVARLLADPARRMRVGRQAREELLRQNQIDIQVARQTLEHLRAS
jgi:glycosyltransferase involved in cell wall biosynthesis